MCLAPRLIIHRLHSTCLVSAWPAIKHGTRSMLHSSEQDFEIRVPAYWLGWRRCVSCHQIAQAGNEDS